MASSMAEYLKRYQSDTDKKKKTKKKPTTTAILVVDEDPVWHKPITIEEPKSDSSGEETPLVEEDVEVKRMKRMELIRARKPYNSISEDGSGWVSVSSTSSLKSDMSPQRRKRMDTPSPERDIVKDRGGRPPRPPRRKRMDTPEQHDGGDDLSPPRKRVSVDLSLPRRRSSLKETRSRESPDNDLSPPRRRASVDMSPPQESMRARGTHFDDLSPPRRRREMSRTKEDNVDLSPPKRRASVDTSPPRRGQSQESTRARGTHFDDLSPPRRREMSRTKEDNVDLSPPRKKRVEASKSQENTRARGTHFDDLSPPRRREMSRTKEDNVDLSPPRKRKVEAPKTGLLSAKELREENVRKKKVEQSMYASMDPSLLGKNAEPVFRREGKRISKEELLKEQQDEKPKEQKLEWGQGLAQKRDAESMAQKLELEKDKPFARTRDDPDLDKMLKERLRWGDPMAHLVKQKHSEIILEDLGDDEKMKESGFIVPQTVPSHSWIKRGLECLPNRYGIRPGRHWDGVDRSTGYEKELFKRQNEKRATETEAYMWSVSDM